MMNIYLYLESNKLKICLRHLIEPVHANTFLPAATGEISA